MKTLNLLPAEIVDLIIFYINDPVLAVELNRFHLAIKMTPKIPLFWALKSSKLEYLQFMAQRCKIRHLFDAAVCLSKITLDGNYRIMKFYHQNIHSIANESLIDEAASIGHLNLVKWLDSIGSNASTLAIDWAAEKGHLETLKWLHKHRLEGNTYLGLRFAVANGHLEVVKYLVEELHSPVDFKLIRTAIDKQQLEIFHLLMSHQQLTNREILKLQQIVKVKEGRL